MTEPAIRVRNLSKQYQIGLRETRASSFREAVSLAVQAPFRRFRSLSGQATDAESFWALKNVSFDIGEGEVVGIIGRNGAGKSTLLKILSQITEPTSGEVELHGRVGSLLEVGTGFHPELSGRENVYLNGAILGMNRKEIAKRFDEIVAFAEVEQFLDTPVKRYSSGMYTRLAFAVAAHFETEILLIDEVLAVGDVGFQNKCLGKMRDVSQKEGRTVLFVTHNMSLVQSLCQSAILLNKGEIETSGPAKRVLEKYMSPDSDNGMADHASHAPMSFPQGTILDFHPCDNSRRRSTGTFRTSDSIGFCAEYVLTQEVPGLRVGLDLQNIATGEILFRTFDDDIAVISREKGHYFSYCALPENLLMPGRYVGKLMIGIHNVKWICMGDFQCEIVVQHVDGVNARWGDNNRPGVIMPAIPWSTQVTEN